MINENKKALLVTRVSGFVPQFEMNNVKILQEMGYEVHYASNFDTIVYGNDNSRLEGMGIICHQIDFERSPFSKNVKIAYKQPKKLMLDEKYDFIHSTDRTSCAGIIYGTWSAFLQGSTYKELGVLSYRKIFGKIYGQIDTYKRGRL